MADLSDALESDLPPPEPPAPKGGGGDKAPARGGGAAAKRTFPTPPDDATRLDLGAAARRAALAAAPRPEFSRQGEARALVEACEAELAQKPDSQRAARLHYEIARLYEGPLDDIEEAVKHYELAHQLARDHLPTLRGARRALVIIGKAPRALPYFDAEIRLTSDPGRRAMLHYEKGLLLEDVLGQAREARAAFSAALELDESNPTILKALERAQRRSSAWDELSRTYERTANSVSSDPRHRAAIVAERARIAEARKKQPDSAIELYETALSLDPRAPGAIAALKSLLYGHGRWRELIDVLEKAAEQTSDASARALHRYLVARLHADRLGNLDESIAALESAAAEASDDPLVLEELGRVYEASRRWDRLVDVLAKLVERVSGQSERIGIYQRIGQVCEERLSDEERAIGWYQKALELDAAYLPALQALAKLRARRNEWTSLISMHLAEASATKDNMRRAAAHARVADILESRLDKVEQAIEHHARALGLVPGYAASFKALARLYSEAGRYRELAELYERAVDQAGDEESKIEYLFKIGRLQEDVLGAPQAALAAYRRILELSPKHLGAMHALQRAAERAGRYDDLLEALDYEAERTVDKASRVGIIHRAGEVAEDHLRDDEKALSRYRKVVELEPAYVPALSSLGRLYYRAGRWEDLFGIYRMELGHTPRGAESAALLLKMAELAEERIGREDEALKYYRQAIEADKTHGLARRSLVRLLMERGDNAEVVKLLTQELDLLEAPEDLARAALRIGEIYEHRLGQPERALEAYGRALSAVPGFRPALDARARLLEQKRDYKGLAEALAREAEAASDPADAVAAKFREGEVWRDYVDQPKRAIEAFESVLVRDPNHLGVLLALEPLYVATESWEALAQNFAAQARILENGFARAAALREQARVEEAKQLKSAEELSQGYLSIVRMAPGDASALGVLERLGLAKKDWALLAHVDAKLSALPDEPVLVAAHETRLAESLEATGDPSALDTYRSALARDPENIAAARGFSRMAQQYGDPALMAEAAGHEAKVMRDLERAASLLVEAASLRMHRGDVHGAAKDLERALELHPDHQQSAEALEEVLADAGSNAELIDALSRAAGAAKTKERRAALWVRVGALRGEREGDVGAGLGALSRALKEVPAHLPALMKQAELYSKSEQYKEAADALKKVIASRPDPGTLTVARVVLARLMHEELGDTQGALEHLQKVLDADPKHRGAIGLMLEVRVARGDGEDATQLAQKLVDEARSDAERAAALRQLAVLERKRGRRSQASEALGQALVISGAEVLEEFQGLLAEQKKAGERPSYKAFASSVQRYLERPPEGASALERLHVALGRVLFDELGDKNAGLVALERGLEMKPGDHSLRSELVDRLMEAQRPERAAEEVEKLLDRDPLSADLWQRLVLALRAANKKARADAALEPLIALGGGTDLDRVTVQARARRTAKLEAGAFDAAVMRSVEVRQPEDEPIVELLGALGPLLPKIYPAGLESYGVTSRDRISGRSGHPFRTLADRIAQGFGVEDFDLYIHKAHQGGIELEFDDDPAIMVPHHLTKLAEAEQAYALSRVLCNLARGVAAIDKLRPAELSMLLVAAARTVQPSYNEGAGEPDRLEDLARRVQKAMPWLGRRPVEDAAKSYIASQKPPIDAFLLRARLTASRAALLVADDAAAAIAYVRRSPSTDPALRKQADAILGDSMRYFVSDAAVAVRRRLTKG